MPYYACIGCGVIIWDGQTPDECPVCDGTEIKQVPISMGDHEEVS